jgi:hypothetical protein
MFQTRGAAALGITVAMAGLAAAQPQPSGPVTPTFSPYLNLINRGNPALNYLAITRPTQQLFQQANQIQQNQRQLGIQQQALAQDLQATEADLYGNSVYGINRRIRGTGFIPSFNNTGHYFSTNPALGGGGAVGGRAGGAGAGPRVALPLAAGQVGPRAAFGGAVGGGAAPAAGGMGRGLGAAGGIRR